MPKDYINSNKTNWIQKFQKGEKISQEEKDRANSKQTFISKPGVRMTKDALDAITNEESKANFFNDIGTNLVTMPTQFWPASKEQLELGRSGWGGRTNLGIGAATQLAMNYMVPGVMKKAFKVPSVPIKTVIGKKIPGVNVDDVEKGYHALNKEHWALHPLSIKDIDGDTPTAKELAFLYTLAGGNRTINTLKKIPQIEWVAKKIAENQMRKSSAPTRSLEDFFTKANSKLKYKGISGEDGRDLINLFLYQNETGFKKASKNLKDIDFNKLNRPFGSGKTYGELYPNAKTYELDARIGPNDAVTMKEIDHSLKAFNEYKDFYKKRFLHDEFTPEIIENKPHTMKEQYSPIKITDNVSGYQQMVHRDKSGRGTLVSKDLWKMNPADYAGGEWGGVNEFVPKNRAFGYLMAQKQAGIVDKLGKPFYLIQNNPIFPDPIFKKQGGILKFQLGNKLPLHAPEKRNWLQYKQ